MMCNMKTDCMFIIGLWSFCISRIMYVMSYYYEWMLITSLYEINIAVVVLRGGLIVIIIYIMSYLCFVGPNLLYTLKKSRISGR